MKKAIFHILIGRQTIHFLALGKELILVKLYLGKAQISTEVITY